MRRALGLLLAATLLAAWHVALLHPLVHRDAQRQLVHTATAPAPSIPAGDGGPSLRCEVLAAMTVAIGQDLSPPSLVTAGCFDTPPVPVIAFRASPLHAYRSQAPPAVL